MNILITSAGQRVSLVREFQQEIARYNKNGKVYAVDCNPNLAPACHVAHAYKKIPPVMQANYIEELLVLCEEWNIAMVIPTIDTELLVLAQHQEKFFAKNIHLIISAASFVEQCRDKRKTQQFFLAHGIETPAIFDKTNLQFPLYIKPYDGSLSVDTYLIKSRDELRSDHLNHPKFMFMAYLDPQTYAEFTVDMYYGRDHQVKCIIPRKRLQVRAGEVSKALTVKNAIVSTLKQKMAYVPGAVGCLTLQLFLHKYTEQIMAIEINPRFGGGYPLSYQAGGNFPLWLIKEYFANEEIVYTDDWENNLLMLRYDDEILIHDYCP